MRRIFRNSLFAAASTLGLATAGLAQAQTAPAPDSVQVEEVIVTAQKRDQKTLDVPISLTAYSGDKLDRLGVLDFADLAVFTPGFEVQDQSPNNPGFVMRGITSDSTDPTAEARVSVFQDGVSISKSQASYVEVFDVARVEVAKGPQSTLYGRGALIGAVNAVQNKASEAGLSGHAKVEGGSYGYRLAEGVFNLPVGDTFAVRLSGRVKHRDGYVANALGGDAFQSVETGAARVALNWRPTERLNIDVIANSQHDSPTGTSFKSGGFSPTNPATGQVLASRDPSAAAALAAPANFQGGRSLGVDRTVWGVTGLVTYDLNDSYKLSSISAFRRYTSQETYDPDGLSLPILTGLNDAHGDQWSQELRINYDGGSRVTWFAGVDFFKSSDDQRLPLQFDERMGLADLTGQLNAGAAGSGLPATTPAPAAYFANTAFTGALIQGLVANLSHGNIILSGAAAQAIAANLRANHVEQATTSADLNSVDLFGDMTFKLTSRFEVSAGLRYTRDDKTTGFSSSTIGGRSVLGGAIGAAQLAASGSPAAVAQANAILGALQSPSVQLIPASALPNFGLTFQPTNNNGDVSSRDTTSDGFTWRLVGRYKLNDDASLYASYARGRRPDVLAVGGPTAPYGAVRFAKVAAETVDSYEAGAKTFWLDRRLRLDGALYVYSYDNFQTVEQQGTLFVIANAGKAKAYGFEGQLDFAVTPSLDVFATYAYGHARFESGAYKGNHFRLSPDNSASFGVSARAHLLGGRFDLRPTYSWQSKVFFDDNNDLPAFQ
jgi:outer membrane receptor protein involved in Fe transport